MANQRYNSISSDVAGDEQQFEAALPRVSLSSSYPDTGSNMYAAELSVLSWDQLNIDLYKDLESRDVYNTFAYIFYKFKKAIFVSLVDGKMQAFVPFSNVAFRNEWSNYVRVDPKYASVQDLINKLSTTAGYKPQRALPLDEWRGNNGLFRYDRQIKEGNTNVDVFRDMFETLARERSIPDVEVYVNKRDFPILRQDGTEAYYNIFGSGRKLVSHSYQRYSPILSCSTASGYADLPIPTYEDWARIRWQKTGHQFPSSRQYPVIRQTPWDRKAPIAVFRGSSTGLGVTAKTNQRLNALEIAERSNGKLDVGITKWNLRLRKTGKVLETIERTSYKRAESLTLQQQSERYKYILTLEGHVAAYRLSYELSSGSVVLLADSKWRMWYYKFLKPYVHYVPVKSDLSNLLEIIDWCRSHDDECKRIADNAFAFYNTYLGEKGVLDYLQMLFVELSLQVGAYSWSPSPFKLQMDREAAWLSQMTSADAVKDVETYKYPLTKGPRCVGRLVASSRVLSSTLVNPAFVRSIRPGIDLYETNGIYAVRKKLVVHEAYIGMKTVNALASKCPNFAYTYAVRDDHVFVEYVSGITLSEWLKSPSYNQADLTSLLVQINLALGTAQTYGGFVHCNLHPRHVIVQTLQEPVSFDYNVGLKKPYRYETRIVPVIIDYSSARAITYLDGRGLIESGYVNLYKAATKSKDTTTILTAISSAIGNGVDWISKYLSTTRTDDPLAYGPLHFLSWINDGRLRVSDTFTLKMERGNALFETLMMKYGNERAALLDTINHMSKQTIPKSRNAVVALLIDNLLARGIKDIKDRVANSGDAFIKSRFAALSRYIPYRLPVESERVVIDVPDPQFIQLDSWISLEFVDEYSRLVQSNTQDWLTVWSMAMEAALYDPRLDIFGTYNYDAFALYDQIASNNTLLQIKSEIDAFNE